MFHKQILICAVVGLVLIAIRSDALICRKCWSKQDEGCHEEIETEEFLEDTTSREYQSCELKLSKEEGMKFLCLKQTKFDDWREYTLRRCIIVSNHVEVGKCPPDFYKGEKLAFCHVCDRNGCNSNIPSGNTTTPKFEMNEEEPECSDCSYGAEDQL